jgi:hypothetical protein
MSFLDTLADFIEEKYSDTPEEYCVVLPNRRAGLFLRNMLANRSAKNGKASFVPEIFSIEEYIYRQSGYDAAEELTLLSLLYKSYSRVLGDKAYEFDRFYSSGRLIINDFSDVDDYLADPENVFTYLFRIKEIEGWFPDQAESDLQKNYLEFYRALKEIYFDFKKSLMSFSMAYRGLASRVLAENGAVYKYKRVCFAGLNALSPSFEMHLDGLLKESVADVFWDYDSMYLNDDQHEAGHFLRKARIRWPESFEGEVKSNFNSKKDIDIIGAPYQLSQVQVGLQLLEDNLKEGKETLMVLADEDMLTPLLHSLPESISEKVNISMGFSLRDTFCGQLIHDVLNLHLNPLRSKTQGSSVFYFYDLRRFLSNPLLPYLMKSGDGELFYRLKTDILENPRKLMFLKHTDRSYEEADAAEKLGVLSREISLLSGWTDWKQMCDELENACHSIFKAALDDAKLYQEREAAWKLMSAIQGIRNVFALEDNESVQHLKAIADFIKHSISSLRVPLKGEPLKGIQILGLLETRAMDYDHIIMLGVNEGFLPKSSRNDSFIPFDVRRELALPLPFDTEAVFAYHFYRLLQKAKTIKLVYNTESDPLWGKEPSRYLAQLEHEISKNYPQLNISKSVLDISYKSRQFTNMPLPPHAFIEEKLKRINEKGFSFTALHEFMSCPYRFALHRIMGIPEAPKDPFELDNSQLGNVFHHSVEKLFAEFTGKSLTEKDLDSIIPIAEAEFEKQLVINEVIESEYGTMFLATEVIRDSLMRYLKALKIMVKKVDICIDGIEEELLGTLQLSDGRVINLKGYADRIEKRNGVYCVMDFKTTKKTPKLEWEENMVYDVNNHRNMLQLFFYGLLFLRKRPELKEVQLANYIILKKNNCDPHFVSIKKGGAISLGGDLKTEIENLYLDYLEALHSENQNFEPTASKSCEYCPYKNVLCFSYEEK